MLELIAIIILLVSLGGIVVILARKIPVLRELPEPAQGQGGPSFLLKLKIGIQNIKFLKTFSLEKFLQKALSKIRVLTLKIESRIAGWLQKLRERSQRKKVKENDNYWQEIKDSKKEK